MINDEEKPSPLGTNSHDLATNFVTWLQSEIKKAIGTANLINCTNIMCTVPRLGGTFHLIALTDPREKSNIHGIKSPYFEALKSLNPCFPTEQDIRQLASLGIRFPVAMSAARSLLQRYRSNTDLPELPLQDGIVAKPHSEIDILYGLLSTFANLTRHFEIIMNLDANKQLGSAIQCLLGFLPQFDNTPAAAMKREVGDSLPGEVIDGIRWISEEQKLQLWQKYAKGNKAIDRAFWLLSAVESLQWPGKSEFGIVDSIYSLMISAGGGRSKLAKKFGQHLSALRLFLDPVTFYFNCGCLKARERKSFTNALRGHLQFGIDRLASLSTCFGIWHMDQIPDAALTDPGSSTFAHMQAILNLCKPDSVTFFNTANKASFILKRISPDRFDQLDAESPKESELLASMGKTWGVYVPVENQKPEIKNATIIPLSEGGTLSLTFANKDKSINSALLNARVELGKYFHDAIHTVTEHHPEKVMEEVPWYKIAFDGYYIAFDKHRQAIPTNNDDEFKLRRENEEQFYLRLISWRPNDEDRSVLDVGIGYGRLAQKLISLGVASKKKYYGLDLSSKMINACKEFIPEENLFTAEMRDLDAKLPDKLKFDFILFAYTTFGCYGNDNDIVTLEAASKRLNIWGELIIDQHNPLLKKVSQSVLKYEHEINDEKIVLVKSSSLRPSDHPNDWFDYLGRYSYFRIEDSGADFPMDEFYSIRLYTLNFLRRKLEELGLYAQFYADFSTDHPYDDHKDNALFMNCVATKLPYPFKLLKVAMENVDLYLDWNISSGRPKLQSKFKDILTNLPNSTEQRIGLVLRNRPGISEVELVAKKNPENLNAEQIMNCGDAILQWFKRI